MDDAFRKVIDAGYATDEPVLVLGSPMHGGETAADLRICAPLSMLTRHGLIAGATGTGKTRTLPRVATSRAGQSLLRGIFDTLFGGGRSR
jgi:DNA double-strand break repair helicase HerA and related ATPase